MLVMDQISSQDKTLAMDHQTKSQYEPDIKVVVESFCECKPAYVYAVEDYV